MYIDVCLDPLGCSVGSYCLMSTFTKRAYNFFSSPCVRR